MTNPETASGAVAGPDFTSLIASLDLETKVRLLTGASFFTLHGEESIGLLPMAFSDGPTGVRGLEFSGGPKTSLFPNATLLAASWSEEVAEEVGAMLAEEAQRQHIHVVLGPTINLHRSPLGGRLFEAYSEDPLLTGRFAVAYVRGLQRRGTGACLKHLIANEAETDRHTVNDVVDERTMRELYLLPFEMAVEESGPWSVMAAYNDVNGVPATEQDEVNNRILKGEWGWTGMLMSDWGATKSAGPAANGGLDLVMPGPVGPWGEALAEAVSNGEVAAEVIDDHVRRLLRLADRVGALGQGRTWPSGLPEPDDPVRREQLTRLAASGMTVLRNQHGLLPLRRDAQVAVIGRLAVETTCMGGGSAKVRAPYEVSAAEGIRSRLGEYAVVVDGVGVRSRPRPARAPLIDPVTGDPGMRVRLFSADDTVVSEYVAEEPVTLIGEPGQSGPPAVRVELSATIPAGAMTVGVLGAGDWRWRMGADFGTAQLSYGGDDLAEAVLRPPGWQTDVELDEPAVLTADLRLASPVEVGAAGLVAEPTAPADEDALAAAIQAAQDVDVAVVVVGLTEEQETEALDKSTLALPGRQDELVSAVAAVARRTVVVVNAATPVLMPWRDSVDAILWAGIPGQEGGHAIAAALLNEVEPAGRLVTTIPAADGAAPAWSVTPVEGAVVYAEGLFIGYRGHAAGMAPEPAYWFGAGLGYGEFSYGPAEATGHSVTLNVTNHAGRTSREVVQVYYDPQVEGQPVRLAGWAAADIAAGATAQVTVQCDPRMWRTWDDGSHSWHQLTGGQLVLARGLGDVRQRLDISG